MVVVVVVVLGEDLELLVGGGSCSGSVSGSGSGLVVCYAVLKCNVLYCTVVYSTVL